MLHCLSEGQAAVGRTGVGDPVRYVRPVRRAKDIKIPKEVRHTDDDPGLSAVCPPLTLVSAVDAG